MIELVAPTSGRISQNGHLGFDRATVMIDDRRRHDVGRQRAVGKRRLNVEQNDRVVFLQSRVVPRDDARAVV